MSKTTHWEATTISRDDGITLIIAICNRGIGCQCLMASTDQATLALAMRAHDKFCYCRSAWEEPESNDLPAHERRSGPFDRRRQRYA